jgi:hypothetical protein
MTGGNVAGSVTWTLSVNVTVNGTSENLNNRELAGCVRDAWESNLRSISSRHRRLARTHAKKRDGGNEAPGDIRGHGGPCFVKGAVDNEGASAEEVCRLEAPAGLQPTHGDREVRTEYCSRSCPAGNFPQQFHGVLSEMMPGCQRPRGGVDGGFWGSIFGGGHCRMD